MDYSMFSKNLSGILGKFDGRIIQARINFAIDMLKNGSVEELSKTLNSMDKEQLISKLYEFDRPALQKLNIDINGIKQRVSEADLQKLARAIGPRGNEVVGRIKALLG
ncbi:MAG: membrane trafficking protein [Clostridia bacterium]|nr:membrane trafficking protein [Clostridia bacterium]